MPSSNFAETRLAMAKSLVQLSTMFKELSEEEKTKMVSEATERQQKYQADLAAFEKTPEGRKYRSALAAYSKKNNIGIAKQKYLGKSEAKEPKKAQSAYFHFVNGKRGDVQKEFPDLKGLGPLQQKLGELW